MKLEIGDEIFWNNPNDGIGWGIYTIVDIISGEVVLLSNEEGIEFQAFIDELS